jgi:hypothetical protein
MSISAGFLRLLTVILASSLLSPTLGDEFTNPSNSNADLTTRYTLGQTVQITWDTSLQYVTLSVSHWGQGIVIGSLLCQYSNKNRSLLIALIIVPADALNPGVFQWTIGESDNINEKQIAADPDFVLEIQDPSGQTGTGNGFVDGILQSRGFIITSNVSSSVRTTSTSVSSVSSSTTATSVPKGTSSPAPASGLSIGAKAGIAVGAGIGGLALIAGAYLWLIFRCRRNKNNSVVIPDTRPSNQPSNQPGELGGNPIYIEMGDGRRS